ncbi:MAG TPA: MFS transporter, partial [Candidatus Krumholzibacteriaceae bacterium]|nr:MFS transporter [Candidatus Krumholzibacteriaceae bacterium]
YFQMFINFLLFFYTDVFGIPAAVAGTLFMVSRLWDAVNDPLMGIIADRTDTRWGKFRPYLLWMMIPLAVVGVLLFTTPDFSMKGKIIYAYITYMFMMVAYTAINIPYSALLGVLSPHSVQRTSASTYRFVLAFAGAFIVQGATLPLVNYFGGEEEGISLSGDYVIVREVDAGTSKLIIEASDGQESSSQEFLVKINRENELPPSVRNPIGDIVMEGGFEKRRVNISALFSNPNEHRLSYQARSSNSDVAGVSVEGDSVLIIDEKAVGISDITVTVSDEIYGKKDYRFEIRINETGNSSPTLAVKMPDRRFDRKSELEKIELSPFFSDPDGEQLDFMAFSGKNEVLSADVNGSEATLKFRKTGIADIFITAFDGRGGVERDTFQVQVVTGENDPPAVLNSIGDLELTEGFGEHSIDISGAFTDLDGDRIKYSIKKVDVARGFQYTLAIYGILACFLFYLTFAATNERVKPSEGQKRSLKNDLKDLVHNRPWMILLVMSIFTLGYVIIRMGTIMYYFKYYIENEILASLFMVSGTVAVIAGVACTDFLSRRLGKKRLYLIIMGLSSVFTILFYYIPGENIFMVFTVHIIISLAMAPQAPLLWAMYADTVDYSEWKNGRRATGLVFSAATFSQKFGMALGGGLAGWLLARFNFQPNVAQSAQTLTGIRLMMSYIPAAGTVIATIAALFYELDDKTMKRIEKELADRKEDEEEGKI